MTKEEALALVGSPRETIHCLVQAGFALIGADWTWAEFENAIKCSSQLSKSGQTATSMGYGLAVNYAGWKFFETRAKICTIHNLRRIR